MKSKHETRPTFIQFLTIIICLLIIGWFFGPFLMDLAAARPRLPQRAPAQPTAVIWPTMAPAPAQPDQAPAAVPAIPQIIIIPDPGQAPTAVPVIALPTVEPLPTMAPTAVPTMAPAPVNQGQEGQEGQGGATYTLTNGVVVTEQEAQFLADCARGQANGRRVSPRCPARAAELLPGGGR